MNIFTYDTRTISTSWSDALPVTTIARSTNETTMSYDAAYVGFNIEKDKAITTRLRRVVTLNLVVARRTPQVRSNLQILIDLIVLR